MDDHLSGKKRPRPPEEPTDNDNISSLNGCLHCELCAYRHEELIQLKIQINDKLAELNNMIAAINYRFNDKGQLMSYIS